MEEGTLRWGAELFLGKGPMQGLCPLVHGAGGGRACGGSTPGGPLGGRPCRQQPRPHCPMCACMRVSAHVSASGCVYEHQLGEGCLRRVGLGH